MHGKLTGAGGEGGCIIGFYIKSGDGQDTDKECHTDLVQLEKELGEMGYTVYKDISISKGMLKV